MASSNSSSLQSTETESQKAKSLQLPKLPPRSAKPLPPIDPALEHLRDRYLQWLFMRSGRSCSTYTGLFSERVRELVTADMYAFESLYPTDCTGFRVPLSELPLPLMTYHALRRGGYRYVDEVEHLADDELLKLRQLGSKGLTALRTALSSCAA